jgi:hypothetical protein
VIVTRTQTASVAVDVEVVAVRAIFDEIGPIFLGQALKVLVRTLDLRPDPGVDHQGQAICDGCHLG